jgi:hypothetical protein
MADLENAVRDAAAKLHEAVKAATDAGYRVEWPTNAAGLPAIAVSETAKVGAAAVVQPGDEYDAMSKAAVVELAAARGLDTSGTKAEVIDRLKNPPAPAAG